MQIQQLRYFLEIAKVKNISAAAKNLYLSQPSLSQQVIKLEEELGVPLLIRHSKHVTLTEAGEQFALQAQRIVGSVDQLADQMHKARDLNTGTLKLGFLWIAGYIRLFDILTAFRGQYPGISYAIRVDGSRALLDQLMSRSLHGIFAIATEKMLSREKDLYYYKVQEDQYVAVISKEHPLAQKQYLSLKDLDGQNVIMPSQISTLRRQLDQAFEQAFVTPEIVCESSQSDVVMQLATHNLGIGFASRTIAESLRTDAVVTVPTEFDISRTVYYVTLRELLDYPTVRSFTRFIRETHTK